ncbi:MAG: zinc ribbon domain-containing protein [Chloroflexi bacterium]|nr:zinc ribbon domain-containing protein [Chloroflexota bacterium]
MTIKTICQECHTPNPPGGKFCSNCGARLPKSTSLICPRCQTPNPTSNFYCDKCGSRLVQEEAPPPSQTPAAAAEDLPTSAKMLSLPVRKPGETGELNADNVMDWLRAGQGAASPEGDKPDTGKLPRLSDLTPEQRGVTDDLPAWLVDSSSQEYPIEAPQDITTEHFLNLIQQVDEEERKKLTGMLSDPAIVGSGKLPEWLQDFVQSTGEAAETPTAAPAKTPTPAKKTGDSDDLDWLSELGPLNTDILSQPAQAAASQPTISQSDGLPDWLDELEPPNTDMLSRPTMLPADPTLEAILSGEGVPDWLVGNNIPDTDGLSLPSSGTYEEEPAEEDDDYPDWLVSPPDTSELALPGSPQPTTTSAADVSAQKAVSDWLTGFDDDEEEEEGDDDIWDAAPVATAVTSLPEEKAHKSLTDWLDDIDESPPQQTEPAAAEWTDDDAAEDWLAADQATAVPSLVNVNLTDWWTEQSTPTDAEADEDEAEEAMAFGMTGALPDWLDELEPAESTSGETTPMFMADMLDDLLGLAPVETASVAEEPAALEQPAEDLSFSEIVEQTSDIYALDLDKEPDWLSELAAFDPNDLVARNTIVAAETAISPPPPDTSAEDEIAETFDLADWPALAAEETVAVPDDEWASLDEILDGTEEETGLADWLEQLTTPTDAAFLDVAEDEAEETLIETGDLPAWVANMRPEDARQQDSLLPSVLPTTEQDFFAIADDMAEADLPEWLEDTAVRPLERMAAPPSGAELPSWIDTESELGEPSSELASILAGLPAALPPEELLQKAEIPDWIQNLKPAELSGQPAATIDFKLETTGPLAGMPDVVKIEPIVAMPRSVHPLIPFTVTPEQQQQARLLRQLVQEEQQAVYQGGAAVKVTGRRGLRFLLAALLLIVVALALAGPDWLTGRPPASLPPAAAALNTAVTAATGKPVLVAFDYTPAMAGELDHQARLLLGQLQANGSPILIVSQSAAGTAVADSLTQSLNTPPINLGMLAGEAIGLRQLGNCVGSPPVACPTLQGRGLSQEAQTALQDLGLIIVLTGERANLLNWVEQVGTAADVPLVVGATQALGPVVAPYYASGQLQGYLDGLPATVALAAHVGASDTLAQAQRQYGAQSLVQLAAALLLVVGALIMATARKKPGAQGR